MNMRVFGRGVAAMSTLVVLAACSNTGLGNVLGSVLGGAGQGASQVSGYVQGVDTRSQYIALQSSSGQSVNIQYDNQTQVVYNNQRYPVTSLDRGDQVTARIQSTNNGSYYTDLVQVDQPVQGSTARRRRAMCRRSRERSAASTCRTGSSHWIWARGRA